MGYKDFTRHPNTKPGKVPTIRLIHKSHSFYPIYFDEYGRKRSPDEVKKIIDELKSKTNNKTI